MQGTVCQWPVDDCVSVIEATWFKTSGLTYQHEPKYSTTHSHGPIFIYSAYGDMNNLHQQRLDNLMLTNPERTFVVVKWDLLPFFLHALPNIKAEYRNTVELTCSL